MEQSVEPGSARDRVLAAAVAAFSGVGYDGVSLREIERRAGLKRGLAGYHFHSKSELWRAAVSWLMDRFHDEMAHYQDVLRVVSAQDRGQVLVRVLVRFTAKHPEYFRLVLLEGSQMSERSRWLAQEHIRKHIDFFHRLALDGLDDPRDEAIAYYSLLGAAATVFAVPEQCRALFGLAPSDPGFVDLAAERIADLYVAMLRSVRTGVRPALP